jgi:hypothetical protein
VKLAAILFLLLSNFALATTYSCDGSQSDCQAKINGASDGDTVAMPSGTFSYTTDLAVTKKITLTGNTTTDSTAGTAVDNTIIQDNVVRDQNNAAPILYIVNDARVTGITFAPGANLAVADNGGVRLYGTQTGGPGTRLDHCHFQNGIRQLQEIQATNWVYGVIDHCVFDVNSNVETIMVFHEGWGGSGSYGDASWSAPSNFGSKNFLFIEDNYIHNTTTTLTFGAIDAQFGGRYVVRHNHFYNTCPYTHGTEGRYRGARACEIYNNDFHISFSTASTGQSRSGVTIWHDNTWAGVLPDNGGEVLEDYRTFQTFPYFGGASGNNVWDVNDAHGLYESGTHSGGNAATVLTDGTKTWTVNQWVGYTISNTDQVNAQSFPYCSVIQSNTATTITYFLYNNPPTFNTGDHYQIYKLTTALDQPGRGQGDLITGDTPINSSTGTPTWPHDALEPCYSWNNYYTGNVAVNLAPGIGPTTIVENRDFYNNTPMPGYVPYTYPHPLVGGAGPQQGGGFLPFM